MPKTDIYPAIFLRVHDFHHKIQYQALRVLVIAHQHQLNQLLIHVHTHLVQIKVHYAHQTTLRWNVPQHLDRQTKNWHQRNPLIEQMIGMIDMIHIHLSIHKFLLYFKVNITRVLIITKLIFV